MSKSEEADGGCWLCGWFSATVIAANGEPATAAAEAQVLQSQLAEIGIKLDIRMMELNVYVDTWLKGDFDMAVALNGGSADPYTMYGRYWTKAGNLQKVAQYIDDTLDDLMQKGRAETDLENARLSSPTSKTHNGSFSVDMALYGQQLCCPPEERYRF